MTQNGYITIDDNYRTTNSLQLREKKGDMMNGNTNTDDNDIRLGCEIIPEL